MWGFVVAAMATGAATADDPFFPDDPLFADQWALYNIGQEVGGVAGMPGADVRAPCAWGVHRGTSSVTVAIVGTGVDPHPEYADRLLEGCATVGDPYNSLDTGPAGPKGTHVAGIIAAATNNATGIAGLNRSARILPIRVADDASPTEQSAAAGITWAVDHGADIIVVPLQFYSGIQALQDAVTYAVDHDVLIIAPTGGTGDPVVAYPARFPG
jgi:subtilisin family serine protease